MVITPHALVAARLSEGRHSSAAFVSGLASHYLLDQVPHLDYDHRSARGKALVGLELTVVALLLGSRRYDKAIWAGVFGGLLPDVVKVLAPQSLPTLAHDRLHTSARTSPRANVALQSLTVLWALKRLKRLKRRGR